MAQYIMKEMPDMQNTGKQVTFPAFARILHADFKRLVKRVHEVSGFHEGIIEGVLIQVAEELADLMSDGRSVKVDGIGIFTPTLVLHKGKEREGVEENDTHLNARSIRVGGVNFKVDKDLLMNINKQCKLERSSKKARRSSTKYTEEQRLELAKRYLDTHAFLTVRGYQQLTGLLRTAATKELRKWGSNPESGIDRKGDGSHRVYVKKN